MSILQRRVLFFWEVGSPDPLQWNGIGAVLSQLTSDPSYHLWCSSLVPPGVCGWKLPRAGKNRFCLPGKFLTLAWFVLEVMDQSQQDVSQCAQEVFTEV